VLDLTRLSDQQRTIVLAPEGPLLVVAGPGCGKTTLIAARIAYLVAVKGIDPASILAMAFTRVAAGQLRERLHGLLGDQARQVEVSTFHALGLRIIRHWQEELGFGSRPLTVYDQYEARQVLADCAATIGIDLKRLTLAELALEIDRFRLDGCSALELALARQLVADYEARLRQRGAVDFPSMLALPLRLFSSEPRALQLYRDTYRYVFADELQDVSPAQYDLLRRIAERHRNLAAVGDLAQTLYAYRGAGGHVFRRFREDFAELAERALDENFRSTAHIVAMANRLGEQLSYAQPLHTENPAGPKPHVYLAADEQAEAVFVAGELLRLLDSQRIACPGEVAVLYRTNAQAGQLVAVLREARIPYRVAGDGELFSQPEVQQALAYLRLAVNPGDERALARIVNVPPRGLARLARRVEMEAYSVEALTAIASEFGADAAARTDELVRFLGELSQAAAVRRPAAILDMILEDGGLAGWLSQLPDAEVRLKRLQSLRDLLQEAADGLAAWLVDLALSPDLEPVQGDAEAVLLTTIHRAKGREWPVVFIVGVEEGLLPHARAIEDGHQGGLEEETRVAYVALTRARERLYLTGCRRRRRGDLVEVRQPSRFLSAAVDPPSFRAA